MRIFFLFSCVVFSMGFFINDAFANEIGANDINFLPIGEVIYYPDETNRLIMQFDINTLDTETMSDLAIFNVSLAPLNYVLDYKLWMDNGDKIFKDSFQETLLGSGTRDGSSSTIYWRNIGLEISNSTRFYITVDTASRTRITNNTSLIHKLFLSDVNKDNAFDFQYDVGVFFNSGLVLPSNNEIFVSDTISIRQSLVDRSEPVGAINYPENETEITGRSFLLRGGLRDQGGGILKNASLIINGNEYPIEGINGLEEWEYQWNDVEPGTYTIALKAEDSNYSVSSSIDSVTVHVVEEKTCLEAGEVCGTDGILYKSECLAQEAGVEIVDSILCKNMIEESIIDGTNAENVITFPDLDSGFWAYEYMKPLIQEKVFEGYPDGTIKPDQNINRAEFSKILALSFKKNYEALKELSFSDVTEEKWFYEYVGILLDADATWRNRGMFIPAAEVSRGEALWMILQLSGIQYDQEYAESLFPDVSTGYRYANAIFWATEHGIVSGYENGEFGPTDKITRAQAAKMIVLMNEYMKTQ